MRNLEGQGEEPTLQSYDHRAPSVNGVWGELGYSGDGITAGSLLPFLVHWLHWTHSTHVSMLLPHKTHTSYSPRTLPGGASFDSGELPPHALT